MPKGRGLPNYLLLDVRSNLLELLGGQHLPSTLSSAHLYRMQQEQQQERAAA
jgi:hypothetical protein